MRSGELGLGLCMLYMSVFVLIPLAAVVVKAFSSGLGTLWSSIDNTVAIRERSWQIEKTKFRHTLAGSTVTIHEHLEGTVSIRYGPHVVGGYSGTGEKLIPTKPKERGGKDAPMTAAVVSKTKPKAKTKIKAAA